MKLFKRKILVKRNVVQNDSGNTVNYDISGGTKILLTNKAVDLGFFDVEPYLMIDGMLLEDGNKKFLNIGSKGVGHFYINSNVRWKIRKMAHWIVLDNYDGKNNAKININLGKYTEPVTRSGDIIIEGNSKNNFKVVLTIKQNPFMVG